MWDAWEKEWERVHRQYKIMHAPHKCGSQFSQTMRFGDWTQVFEFMHQAFLPTGPSHNYCPSQKIVLLRDTGRKVANQSERLEKSKCKEMHAWGLRWATRKMKSKVVKKLSWVRSTLCSCKPTIQMYEDSNLSLTSVQRGAKQTSKQKVTFVTIESREFFGSSEWLDRESCSL